MKRIVVGLSGASGSVISKKLIETLQNTENEIYLIATPNAEKVFQHETGLNYRDFINKLNNKNLHVCEYDDMFNKIASGSFKTDGMIIVPCSMGSVGKIANGISDNLMLRAADVHIKEQRRLIIVPREAPLSPIHLENLLKLSKLGVMIYLPVPAFYTNPESINDVINQIVGRLLDYLGIENNLKTEWQG